MLGKGVGENPIPGCLALIAAFLPLFVACSEAPVDPELEEPPDTAEVRGTLVLAGDSVDGYVTLTWIPGTESIVYSTSPSSGGCAIKSVDVGTGAAIVLDDDCAAMPGSRNNRWHNIVAANDGSALYYTSRVGVDPATAVWELRSIDLANGAVSTLREDVVYILALSTDARMLAYVAGPNDSLVLRDVVTGVETVLGGFVFPLLFSPDGTELLFEEPDRRPYGVSIADGSTEAVALPEAILPYAYAYHWGVLGLKILASDSGKMQILDLETGGVTLLRDELSSTTAELQTTVWSANGARVAYGIYRCLDEFGIVGGDCRQERVALYVANVTAATSTRVAYVRPRLGSTAFSPSGDRIVYSVNGDLYLSDVR
jgi:hypothetical protein